MGFRSLASVVLIGIILTGCGGGGGGGSSNSSSGDTAESPAPTPTPVATTACTTELAAIFNDLLTETNRVRIEHGFSSLKFSFRLGQAAQGHAKDMADNNYFAHTSPDGLSTIASRIQNVDYQYSLAGENLAAGYHSATDVVTAWLNSPGHRENLLHPDYTDIGFGLFFDESPGIAPEATFDSYWAQNFGRPNGSNTDIEEAYIPSSDDCSVGTIASGDNSLLNGTITADKPANVQTDSLTTETSIKVKLLTANHNSGSMSTPEPAIALGLLPAALGLIFSRRNYGLSHIVNDNGDN